MRKVQFLLEHNPYGPGLLHMGAELLKWTRNCVMVQEKTNEDSWTVAHLAVAMFKSIPPGLKTIHQLPLNPSFFDVWSLPIMSNRACSGLPSFALNHVLRLEKPDFVVEEKYQKDDGKEEEVLITSYHSADQTSSSSIIPSGPNKTLLKYGFENGEGFYTFGAHFSDNYKTGLKKGRDSLGMSLEEEIKQVEECSFLSSGTAHFILT